MARWLPLLLGAALWTACDGDDDDDTTEEAADDDTTPVLDDPAVTAVSPSSGPPEGGYPANVYGTYFTTADDMQITFGERVATIQECADTSCTVTVPAAGEEEGEVDVTVTNSNGEGTLEDGFTYELNLQELTTYVVYLARQEYAYPDAYTPPPTSTVYGRGWLIEPMELDVPRQVLWGNQLPTLGNCTMFDRNTGWTEVEWSSLSGGSELTLSGPATWYLDRYWSYYKLDDGDVADWSSGIYSLEVPGGDDLPADVVTDALFTPPVFTTVPAMDPTEISPASFQAGVTLTIAGECETAAVALDLYYPGSPYLEYEETVLCVFPGAGQHTIAGAYTSLFPEAAAAITHVECYSEVFTETGSGAMMSGIGRSIISGVMYIQ
jgi:hypothetical protein